MSRIAYVNGRYQPHAHAGVHIEDRGYQFADGVYEVCEVLQGHLVDEPRHMARLSRSLSELEIRMPMTSSALGVVLRETVRRNRVKNGIVYVQVTRGVAPRDHPFPPSSVKPALVVTARNMDARASAKQAETGICVISTPDTRWDRVDIKSVSLLPNILAKEAAKKAGAKEAWLIDGEGNVTEGSSTNAWIINKDGKLITRPANHGILRGVTRAALFDLARREGIEIEERAFSLEEAKSAREAFITAATMLVMPVVKIDDTTIGNGAPGSVATNLRSLLHSVTHIADA